MPANTAKNIVKKVQERKVLKGRIIFSGKCEGTALVSKEPISFYGSLDLKTGVFTEKKHELFGRSVKGSILVFPCGKGSTVGSYILYRLKKNNAAPQGIINSECEPIVAVGAIISEIPAVDRIDITKIKSGNKIKIEGGTISIESEIEKEGKKGKGQKG